MHRQFTMIDGMEPTASDGVDDEMHDQDEEQGQEHAQGQGEGECEYEGGQKSSEQSEAAFSEPEDAFASTKKSVPTAAIVNNPSTGHSGSDFYIEDSELGIHRKAKSPCVGIVKIVFLVLMLAVVVAGTLYLCTGVLITREKTLFEYDQSVQFISIGTIVVGVLMVIAGIAGMLAAYTESKRMGIIFILLIITCLFFHILITIRVGEATRAVMEDLSNRWENLQESSKAWVETRLTCCGFEDGGDRAASPCPAEATLGCEQPLKDMLDKLYRTLYWTMYVSCGLDTLAVMMILLISFLRFPSKSESRA